MAQGQPGQVDAPDTLPGDFFDKQASAPDTLPGDFFEKKQARPSEASLVANRPGKVAPIPDPGERSDSFFGRPVQGQRDEVAGNEQVGREYAKRGPAEFYRGAMEVAGRAPDQRESQVAHGLNRMVRGAGVTAAPVIANALPMAAAEAPLATGTSLLTGVGAQKGVEAAGKVAGMSPDNAELAGNVAGITAAGFGPKALAAARGAIPSTTRAGAALGSVKAAAGDIPIDMAKPGDTALELYTQSQRGASLPKVVRDFVNRATKPGSEPLTYKEAKDFQSNVSQLSSEERMQLKPNTLRLIGRLNQELKQSLEGAAAKVGKGDMFTNAMKEYRKASQLRDFGETAKEAAIKALPYGITTGAMGYLAKKLLRNK